MSRRDIVDVAIVGAGMVGAAAALALARDGFDVALVEPKSPAPWRAEDEIDLRVVALAQSSIELLRRLDVWTSITRARYCAYRKMHVWDALAPGELTFDAADEGASSLGVITENRLVQHVLWEALQRESRLALHCPTLVTSTECLDDRRVLVFEGGGSLSARLIVAADGADSALRMMLGVQTRDRDYEQRAIVAHVATERPHQFTAWQRFLPNATLAFLPLADGRSSVVWSVSNTEAARLLALDEISFRGELGAAFEFRLGAITSIMTRASFPLRMRLADAYRAPRFALIGDAAHVVHPLAGQGVNLGFRDVVELCEVLSQARSTKRDIASDTVLRRYERRRRSDNAIAAHSFDAIQRSFGNAAMPIAAVRGIGLELVDRVAPLKRLFARHAAGRL